jgi:hypothetical protein
LNAGWQHRDFKELLSAFNAGQVRYLIVGGYAVSYHAQPRVTKDMDILIGAGAENSKTVRLLIDNVATSGYNSFYENRRRP